MELLKLFKLNKRITTNAFDEEISILIDNGKAQLRSVCQIDAVTDDQSRLVDAAILTYVKANFGTNPDKDSLMQSFNSMLVELSIKLPLE